MGYNTATVGHIDVEPPLRLVEQRYLTAFSRSRRYARPGGPYEIPANPGIDPEERSVPADVANVVAAGQPGYWCDWAPCWEGCCLMHTGKEKSYEISAWLEYLIDHLLRPGAKAVTSGSPWLDGFGFDHVLNGVVACSRGDNRAMWLIRVEDNVVREEVLRRGDPDPWM